MLSSGIKKVVEQRYGQSVRYPVECDALASDISKCTGRNISSSTIKRLWGFIDGASTARCYTLDTLAEYCGHGCFDDLVNTFNPLEPTKPEPISSLSLEDLTAGNMVTITFGNKGRLSMVLNNNRLFKVLSSVDCQLEEGDTFSCIKIEVGFPVFINDWHRSDESLGSATIAKLVGINSISLNQEP